MKYLHKYVTKSVDFCTIGAALAPHPPSDTTIPAPNTDSAQTVVDEIKEYINCRYVGAMEAAWRLFGFKQCTYSPVHLPGESYAAFDYTLDVQGIQNILERKTKLEAFFILNQSDPSARIYRYIDIFPSYRTTKL